MPRKDRYDTTDLDENQFEPGSSRRVLKNLLGITSKREMDRMEGREQVRVFEELAGLYDSDHRFTADDICRMHRLWLGGFILGCKEKVSGVFSRQSVHRFLCACGGRQPA
jgi:cell filamentation protein